MMMKQASILFASACVCASATAQQAVDLTLAPGTPAYTPVAPVKTYLPDTDLSNGQRPGPFGQPDNLPQSVSIRCSTAGATGLEFCGVVLDYDGADWLMIKVQAQTGTGKFSHVGFYHGTTTGWAGMTGGAGFFALTSEFTSATMTVTHDGAGNVQLDFTDTVGGPAQSYSRGGWTPRAGTVSGLQGFAGIFPVDNFSEGFTDPSPCDRFNRNDGAPGSNWIIQGSATMTLNNHAAYVGSNNACLFVGASGDVIDEVEGDIAFSGTASDYVALVCEGAEGDNLFVKVQAQTGTGMASNIGFYSGNNGGGWAGLTGGGSFFSLPAGDEFATAHAKLQALADGSVRLVLTNLDGNPQRVQVYTRGGWTPSAGNLLGYGMWSGSACTLDNLRTAGAGVDNFNRPNGPLGANWNTVAGSTAVSGNKATGSNFSLAFYTGDYTFGGCYADCDGNGVLDLFDFLCFVNAFNGGCP